jgi:hypothetical protein
MATDYTPEISKFEFILTLESNIIIQRFFNVKDYNPKSRRSMDLYYCTQEICDEISEDLKLKSLEYMSENLGYFTDIDVLPVAEIGREENYLLEIKLGDEVFISRIFPAQYFHPKARYSVNIRTKIRRILSDLTEVLSSDELETAYLQYEEL